MDHLNSRVYILNGQPFIIQQNDDINSVNNISGDILQNALQEVDSSPSDSVHSQFIQSVQNPGQENCVDELVTFEQENGDDSSTIHLTVEQAVEMGIEFDVAGVDDPNASFSTSGKVINADKDQFIFKENPSENICLFSVDTGGDLESTTFDETEQGVTPSTDDLSKLKLESNIIEQLNRSVNPQLTLIPQIQNGTITYTLQIDSNAESNQLNSNDLSTSKDSVHMLPIVTSVPNSSFDLSSLTTSTQSTLVQSSLSIPPISLNLPESQDREHGVNFVTNSVSSDTNELSHILPSGNLLNTESETVSMTKKLIDDNLGVFEHGTLPQIMESEIPLSPAAGNRFFKLSSNTKSISNSKGMSLPMPSLQPISSIASSVVSTSQTQTVRTTKISSSISESYQVNVAMGDQMKIQTMISPEPNETGDKPLPIRPPTLNGISKEISKVVARFQSAADQAERVGTNKNPIQLVQQGKTFTSVQSLSQHQLKHVAAVLQKNNFDIEQTPFDKNIIFDKKTNTKIIYRMIYPEDLHLKEASDSNDGGGSCKRRGRPLKNKLGEPPESEEPPRKKVALPRTRSGRLSRPPRHMVRDYKRITSSASALDADDPEQDGAYSDYQTDDQDDVLSLPHANHNQLLPGLADTKKRRISSSFRCPKCDKIYLGIHRMEIHFSKYPDHRPQQADQPKHDENSAQSNVPLSNSGIAGVEKPGGGEGDGGGGGGGEKLGGVGGVTMKANGRLAGGGGGGVHSLRAAFSKKKSSRRRGNTAPVKPDQMRTQLKQLLDLCSESELVEVVGPVVASVLSAWELLLLRVDALTLTNGGECSRMRVDALCQEIKALLDRFHQVSTALFHPVDESCAILDAPTFQMEDLSVCSVLGIPCGLYRVDESILKVDRIMHARANTNTRTAEQLGSGDGGGAVAAVTSSVSCDVTNITPTTTNATSTSMVPVAATASSSSSLAADHDRLNQQQQQQEQQQMGGGVVGGASSPSPLPSSHPAKAVTSSSSSGSTVQFLLGTDPHDDIIIDNHQHHHHRSTLESNLDRFVNERLQNFTSGNRGEVGGSLSKATSDEQLAEVEDDLAVLNNALERVAAAGVVGGAGVDDLAPLLGDQRRPPHVSASTEDLIKSLENFVTAAVNDGDDDDVTTDNHHDHHHHHHHHFVGSDSTDGDFHQHHHHHHRVSDHHVDDALDFDVLSQNFHSTGNNSQ